MLHACIRKALRHSSLTARLLGSMQTTLTAMMQKSNRQRSPEAVPAEQAVAATTYGQGSAALMEAVVQAASRGGTSKGVKKPGSGEETVTAPADAGLISSKCTGQATAEQLDLDSSWVAAGDSCIRDASSSVVAADLKSTLRQAAGGCCIALIQRWQLGDQVQYATSCAPLAGTQQMLLRKAARQQGQQRPAPGHSSGRELSGQVSLHNFPLPSDRVVPTMVVCGIAVMPITATNAAYLSAPASSAAAETEQAAAVVYVLPLTRTTGKLSPDVMLLLVQLLTGDPCSPCICAGECCLVAVLHHAA